ncbi:MAG TPA: zf-HC2 domain-containing protein [Pyrinomonadaceae bacterium]|nr:zf-HC2 domain-containing protein [Pyrinomonadaceae bacterium]
MKFEDPQKSACRIGDISAYIDGELSPDAEVEFELHVAGCADCRRELNMQKNLLRELDVCLTTGELELPKDFAKTVAVRAESSVNGLRCRSESIRAIGISAGLLLFAVFTLGADTRGAVAALNSIGSKLTVVASSVFHFVFDVALGIAIIFRSFGSSIMSGSAISILSIFLVAFLSLLFLSRLLLRPHRA